MKARKFGVFAAAVVCCSVLLTGCFSQKATWSPISKTDITGDINIAVIGPKKYLDARTAFFNGMNLAMEEIRSTGIKIEYEVFDDDGNYNNGVTIAKTIATDDKFMMAFTFQDFDVVDTVADVFEQNKKPLVIADGCYDYTMQKKKEYVLNALITGVDAGQSLGRYIVEKGYKWLAISHSDTDFERGVSDGVEDKTTNTGTKLIDTVPGPKNKSDVDAIWDRWNLLGIECVVIAHYDTVWPPELIKLIKEKKPDMAILTDYIGNYESVYPTYGDALNGVIMVSPYPVKESSNKATDFNVSYKKRFGDKESPTARSIQGYDLTKMIVDRLRDSTDPLSFMKNMKSQVAYDGVSTLKFNSNGTLNNSYPQMLELRDGQIKSFYIDEK